MTPHPWGALADALETLAHTLRTLPHPLAPPAASPLPAADTWLTMKQFSSKHPAFPLGTITRLVAAREANGLRAAGIVREVLTRKIVVHEARLLAWLLGEPLPLGAGAILRERGSGIARRSRNHQLGEPHA